MKHMIGVGALKPNKVKQRKVTDKVSGHMPVGKEHKTAKHA